MTYFPNIKKYSLLFKSGRKSEFKGQACFAGIKHNINVKSIKATFEIDDSLSAEQTKLYFAFLKRILHVNKFSLSIRGNLAFANIEFSGTHRTLSYLSFFRYVQEFPSIVKGLNFDLSDEEIFAEFIKLHRKSQTLTKCNCSGHLVLNVMEKCAISLKDFLENQNKDYDEVFKYFKVSY